jgi:hypothetical protein
MNFLGSFHVVNAGEIISHAHGQIFWNDNMKIIVNRTEVFDFDYDKEIEREQLQRQLDFINTALIEKDSEKALEIYDNMPYDEENECPEQEYTGLWTGIIWG